MPDLKTTRRKLDELLKLDELTDEQKSEAHDRRWWTLEFLLEVQRRTAEGWTLLTRPPTGGDLLESGFYVMEELLYFRYPGINSQGNLRTAQLMGLLDHQGMHFTEGGMFVWTYEMFWANPEALEMEAVTLPFTVEHQGFDIDPDSEDQVEIDLTQLARAAAEMEDELSRPIYHGLAQDLVHPDYAKGVDRKAEHYQDPLPDAWWPDDEYLPKGKCRKYTTEQATEVARSESKSQEEKLALKAKERVEKIEADPDTWGVYQDRYNREQPPEPIHEWVQQQILPSLIDKWVFERAAGLMEERRDWTDEERLDVALQRERQAKAKHTIDFASKMSQLLQQQILKLLRENQINPDMSEIDCRSFMQSLLEWARMKLADAQITQAVRSITITPLEGADVDESRARLIRQAMLQLKTAAEVEESTEETDAELVQAFELITHLAGPVQEFVQKFAAEADDVNLVDLVPRILEIAEEYAGGSHSV